MAGSDSDMKRSRLQAAKIPSLDGVRGISILIVFLAHAGLDRIVPGRLGVNIFFILSGYLITTLMISEREKTGWISLKLFYLRRVLRIFPPMYTILGCTLLFLFATHQLHGISFRGVASQLFYYQNYYFDGPGIIPGLGVLWSLAVEEHFYLLFPPLMLLFLSRFKMSYGGVAVALTALCGVIFLWRTLVVFTFPNGLEWARDATDCRADSILFGCVLACWEKTDSCKRIFSHFNLERFFLPSSLVIILATLVIRNPIFRETLRYSLQGLALMPLMYYVVHFPTTIAGKVLNTRWLSTIGVFSYSIYLIHYSVLLELSKLSKHAVAVGALSFAVTLVLAALVHILVEKPMDRVRKTYVHRTKRKIDTLVPDYQSTG